MRGRISTYQLRIICWVYALSLEKESNAVWCLSLTLAERIHQFFQRSSALDLEKHLIVVIRHLDIKVLADWVVFWFVRG